ncbi:MAG: carboxylesterase/lipase family protein [Hyphomonadaceae bacterium]|nr:MAG: para-nitrobenzyl esterase [Caulobacteraceae bacterium]MBT9447524.1 carboxylesterase/lipase family protein [Hyphomonadaceae bacterium]TPW05479.1 MAG: para-nitrobenzyl esterase [Alphaproteobacteria bacterium]
MAQPLNRRNFLEHGVLAGCAATLTALSTPAHADLARPTANTRHGRVRGYRQDDICVFKGVRYGADTGPRRFQAPLPPVSWGGVRDAIDYGPASPQRRGDANQSEDCLFLNVWTPGLRDNRRRAVMVYLHGGAYNSGSGSSPLYDGARLARRGDVVVVTLNHRLNALGYGYLARLGGEAFADSGNVGQLDLILALEWVRDNITEFGGDPGRVMVFGQSGGGAKIATLMAMPAARGLFHSAATMSGQQVTASGPLNATRRAEALLQALGLTRAAVEKMRTIPVPSLINAMATTDPVLGDGSLYFGPVLDERNLPRHPFYPDAASQGLSIPMILGNTRDETRGFVGSDRSVYTLTWEEVAARLPGQLRIDVDPDHVVQAYRRQFPHMSPSDVYFAAGTAGRSWRAQVIEAEERARAGAPAYVYQLNFSSPVDGGILGAHHTLDIPLVFNTLDVEGSRTGSGPDAVAASNAISEAFIALAKSGNPNCSALATWSPYTLPTRETMIIDAQCHMENNPRRWEREFFARIPYIQPGS